MEKLRDSFSRRHFVKGLAVIGAGIAVFGLDACGGNSPNANPTDSNQATKNSIKVGIMAPYTGAAASKGKPGGDGVQDCIKYINTELGGVAGHQIDVVFRDNQYTASNMTTIINEFISDGVMMFTTHASAEMTAVMGIARARNNCFGRRAALAMMVFRGEERKLKL